MHQGKKVKNFIEKNDIKKTSFARKIGVSNQNLYDIFKREKIASILQRRIIEDYNLPIDFFENEDQPLEMQTLIMPEPTVRYGANEALKDQMLEDLREWIEELKKMSDSKDTMIRISQKYIEDYKTIIANKDESLKQQQERIEEIEKQLKIALDKLKILEGAR